MLSYLIVITKSRKLENRMQKDKKTDWHEDIQMDTKTKKKKTNTVSGQCWSPIYRVSLLSTNCGGCHPKGLIVASLYKIKIIITIIILLFTRQFSFLLDKKKIN